MNKFYIKEKLIQFFNWVKNFITSSKFTFWMIGIATSVWFLIRVIPKPQRAGYPCMRAAAPIMSGFVLYILSLGGASILFRRAITRFKKAKYISAVVALSISALLLVLFFTNDVKIIYAKTLGITWTKGVLPDEPNNPMGEGWGIFPGRVAWTYSPNATNEDCTNDISDAYFMAQNTNQDTINMLANKAVKIIGGQPTVKASWDTIFKSFNERKTGTAKPYTAGEKIFIKVNNGQAGWAINPSDLSETGQYSSGTGQDNIAMANTSPQAVLAFLVQLIDTFGVAQSDIMIGEPMTHVYKSMYDLVHPKYPDVKIIDKEDHTGLGRTTSTGWKSKAIIYSDKAKVMTSANNDALMNELYNANYLINISALKAHARAGVTFSAKNHFGSHGSNHWDSFHLHNGLVSIKDNDKMSASDYPRTDYSMYRVLTDLMGHEKLGRNTVLFVVDGLWGGIEATDMPVKFQMTPFNNDWPSSLFVAQDEIAMQSVCLDFLRAEAENNSYFYNRPFFPGIDDFLHQGATKANWPDSISSTGNPARAKWYKFAGYDPEGDGTFMPASLGVHEHWNNSTDKDYSRNLYSNGTGIELVSYPANLVKNVTKETVKNITVTVKSGDTLIANARVTINGSSHLTDSEGKVVVSNFKDASIVKVYAKKAGYQTSEADVTVGDDTQVSLNLQLANGVRSISMVNSFDIYPNPVNASSKITFSLNSSEKVSLYIITMDGRIIKQLRNEMLGAGTYTNKIDISALKSGSYICVLKSGSIVNTSKFLLK